MKEGGIPQGLTMALAQNVDAMMKFSQMDENQKQSVINMTHSISSREEMRAFVDSGFKL